MTIRMDWQNATFKLSDVIKMISYAITITIFGVTLHLGLAAVREAVSEIRVTQVENTKKNDLRWEAMGLEINALKLNQSLMEQRLNVLENKFGKK